MFCDDKPCTEDGGESMNNLDSALYELGMLSTITNASNQYFHEMRRKSFGSKPNTYNIRKASPINSEKGIILHQNSRYVSNVTIGLRMKRATNNRTSPYLLPDRIRTRSENSDGVVTDDRYISDCSQDIRMEHFSNYVSILDPKISCSLASKTSQPCLMKSRSLENIRVENIDASQPSHEMEFVSSRIQKLKVME